MLGDARFCIAIAINRRAVVSIASDLRHFQQSL
jgi:hypothetical protein